MTTAEETAVVEPRPADVGSVEWANLVDGPAAARSRPRPPSLGRVVGRFVAANLLAVALLMAGSVWASQEAAQNEAIADARHTTDLIATLLVEPNIDEGLAAGDPDAVAALDAVLRDRLAAADVMRVKIWTPDGDIVYSDQPRLIGRNYPLGRDDLTALRDGVTGAELSDVSRPENQYERSFGRLLEVYRAIQTPDGRPLLLETYSNYKDATARQADIWYKFAPISVAVLLALLVVQLPLATRMVSQIRATAREREHLQARALDASTEERRRIAGSLHDGIVQDVSASSLLLAGAADRLRESPPSGPPKEVAELLAEASVVLRESVGSLRSLLVEIYPPNLERAGLASALADLAAGFRPRGIDVTITVPDRLDVPLETATLLFRTAQEALLNVAKHARARHVEVTVNEAADALVLTVTDDGAGFALPPTLSGPDGGHLGLCLLADLAAGDGATLDIRTAPGAGTCLRLTVPHA